ncbi:MAG: solute-binding protein [Epsilonproteobacteria bacterium]|nr:solute-binding protein [Campylobacterota bacterium]
MKFIVILFSTLLFAKELVFYCGITMAKPMAELADKFHKKTGISIKIIPGSSKGLLKTIKKSKMGDLYLPGSEKYVLNNKTLFPAYEYVGFNKLAIIVKSSNPKNIKTLNDLLRKDVKDVLCNYKLSSCGKESKKVLQKKGIFWKVYDKCISIELDSKPLNNMVLTYADAGLNWKATTKWKEFKNKLKAIDIKEAKKHNLYLAVIKYSKELEKAKKFLNFVKQNIDVMKRYGFED